MKINKNLYESKIKNLGKLINILELFFDKKDYNKKDFLKKIKIKIKNDINLEGPELLIGVVALILLFIVFLE